MTNPILSDKDYRLLQKLEEALWRSETRFDPDFMERVLAEDFSEFGRTGRTYTRQEIITSPSQPIDAVLPLPNFQARLLTDDIALINYNSVTTYAGIVEYGRRTSIWNRTPDGWKLRFHQGTPYQPDQS